MRFYFQNSFRFFEWTNFRMEIEMNKPFYFQNCSVILSNLSLHCCREYIFFVQQFKTHFKRLLWTNKDHIFWISLNLGILPAMSVCPYVRVSVHPAVRPSNISQTSMTVWWYFAHFLVIAARCSDRVESDRLIVKLLYNPTSDCNVLCASVLTSI